MQSKISFFLQCRNYLEPAEIFKGEVEETIEKVRTALKILRAFKQTYEDHRAKIKDYFTQNGGGDSGQQQQQQQGEEGQEQGQQESQQQSKGESGDDEEAKEWEFAPQLVFHRFDKFMERVETVMVMYLHYFCNICLMV